jgi:hypothetical protein
MNILGGEGLLLDAEGGITTFGDVLVVLWTPTFDRDPTSTGNTYNSFSPPLLLRELVVS